jgi:amino acid adenylation domain-containing protein
LRPLAQRQPVPNRVRRLGRPQSVVHAQASNAVRWAPGERLNHLLEEACIRFATNDAVIGNGIVLSYRDLNRRANQLARHLLARGIKSSDRVAMMFDRSPETYVAMLAVMKVNAAYVPLDAAFPIERIRFILRDANISAIVSMSSLAKRLSGLQVDTIFLDSERPAIDAQPAADPLTGVAPPIEPLCYIIYTSGTTGNPKGVSIGHSSICNFVRVTTELYGYAPGDRVYQGMSIAFDFSVEEIWVPLMAGATLVPGPAGTTLMGDELGDFLRERRVTVMACSPTLLATIEQDVPDLRILLVGGEACPQKLVARWYRPGRRILNTYGPTEATVTATMTELRPDKPVTIGVPLPTYSIVILDPHEDKTIPTGELGEIGIAGVGLALGYMNRDDLTMKKFIPDFLHIDNNPSGRIYRTGDLGRIDKNGEIDYRGRMDTQVKIRGYRIELKEIEAVLIDLPQVAQAAVTTFETEDGIVEIVAYYALQQGVELPRSEISQALRNKLPVYMVPAFFEQVDVIPMTLSNKADYKRLPKPQQLQRFSAASGYVPPKTDSEHILHAALAEVLRLEHVSTEHHFFNDLGANSLLMARVCAAIRKNPGMSNVSMRDIYMHPTIARLAHHLDSSNDRGSVAATKPEPFHVPSTLSYVTCGALQIGFSAAYLLFVLCIFVAGFQWATTASDSAVELYVNSVTFGAGLFVALTAVSVAAKWLLIGRFKAQSIPIWSFAYFRFWVVMTLMRTSPVAPFIGTPLYNA